MKHGNPRPHPGKLQSNNAVMPRSWQGDLCDREREAVVIDVMWSRGISKPRGSWRNLL